MVVSREILCVVGARPNFIKIAPIMRAISSTPKLTGRLVHTGQHYDQEMSNSFFDDLGISPPDNNLEVGSGSHAVQTAEVMKQFDFLLDKREPDAVLVVGDVNSTIACALVAAKRGLAVLHVEAGLRSNDRSMPEEINRVLTDQISDLLFTTEASADGNLLREGIDQKKIHFVGNVMVDSLHFSKRSAVPSKITLSRAGISTDRTKNGYALLTLHRPATVDNREKLAAILNTLSELGVSVPIAFPIHPRTRRNISEFGLDSIVSLPNFVPLPPVSYHTMIGLLKDARLVLTDSGGVQEEATVFGIPCLTIRENTERPITVTHGTNEIVGTIPQNIREGFLRVLRRKDKRNNLPPLWDGQSAERIVKIIGSWLDLSSG